MSRSGVYAVKGTQIPRVLVVSDAQIEQQAIKYVEAFIGAPVGPAATVQYPAGIPPFCRRTGVTSVDQSVATGVARLIEATANDAAPVIFGYSQGGGVITGFKRWFNRNYSGVPAEQPIPSPTFVLVGSVSRPNGGVFARFPGLVIPFFGITFDGATPTSTAGARADAVTTHDIAVQYDPASDFPTYPLNVVAMANAGLGFLYGHLIYPRLDLSRVVRQQQVGDTVYHFAASQRLPLLMPLAGLGVPAAALAVLDAPLRVIVEAGYNRTTSPGVPTKAKLWPGGSLVRILRNLLVAIAIGLDDGLEILGAGRAFGTTAAGPFGVV